MIKSEQEGVMTFTQTQFERLSSLMNDKGVNHEAFELLADLRRSEVLAKQEVVELKQQLTWRKVNEELPKSEERIWCKDLRGSIRHATFTRYNDSWIFVCSAGYVLDLWNVASWLKIPKEATDD